MNISIAFLMLVGLVTHPSHDPNAQQKPLRQNKTTYTFTSSGPTDSTRIITITFDSAAVVQSDSLFRVNSMARHTQRYVSPLHKKSANTLRLSAPSSGKDVAINAVEGK